MESGNRDQGRPKNAAGNKFIFFWIYIAQIKTEFKKNETKFKTLLKTLFKTESLDC